MNRQTNDGESLTIVVNAELLSLCEVGYYCKTPKIQTPYKNLYWWLHCNPNGDGSTTGGYLAIFIFTSIGGFEVDYTFKIDRSDIEINRVSCHDEPMKHGCPQLTTHEKLRSGNVIEDSEFTIRCRIKFKMTSRTIQKLPYIISDTSIIKLNDNELGTFKPCHNFHTDKQTCYGITWYNDYYPCGYQVDDEGYVSVFINVDDGVTITLEISFALSVGGVLIYQTTSNTFDETNDNLGIRTFSHELCKLADKNNGDIELISIIVFDEQETDSSEIASSNYSFLDESLSMNQDDSSDELLDTLEFDDNETLVVNVNLLHLCEPGHYFETVKRPTACKDLFWWLRCYPNGNDNDSKGFVSLFLYTSIGGFDLNFILTIDRSGTATYFNAFLDDAIEQRKSKFISHKHIESQRLHQNGTVIIRCQVSFKLSTDLLKSNGPVVKDFIEDSCIVELDRSKLKEYSQNYLILTENRTIHGVTWYIRCYPSGKTDNHHIHVCIHVSGYQPNLKIICAMSVGGVLIQKASIQDFVKTDTYEFRKVFSHELCEIADHKNDVIDLMCKIRYPKTTPLLPAKPPNSPVTDTITVTILKYQLENNDIGESGCTPLKYIRGSDKHQWQLLYFSAGDVPSSKGHISLFIKVLTSETKPVIMSGVIKIVGTNFQKDFNVIVKKECEYPFIKFISHKKLRQISGIIADKVVITCEAAFLTSDSSA